VIATSALLFGSVGASAQAIVRRGEHLLECWRDHGLAGRRLREARSAAGVRQRHLDSPSRDRHGRSLHRSHQST